MFTPDMNFDPGAEGAGAALLRLITNLVNSGNWTVPESGEGFLADGTTPGAYSTGNILTTSSMGQTYVAGSITNARAWIRIQCIYNLQEILIVHSDNAGTDEFQIFISFGKFNDGYSGFITQNVPNDGVNSPFASGEMMVLGVGNFAGGVHNGLTGQPFGGPLALDPQRWDFMIGDYSENYSFYALGRATDGIYTGGILYDNVTPEAPEATGGWQGGDYQPLIVLCLGGTTDVFVDDGILADAVPEFLTLNAASLPRHRPWAWQFDTVYERYDNTYAGIAGGMPSHHILRPTYANGEDMLKGAVADADGAFPMVTPAMWARVAIPSVAGLMVGRIPLGRCKGASKLIVGMTSTIAGAPMDTGNYISSATVFQPGGWLVVWDSMSIPETGF